MIKPEFDVSKISEVHFIHECPFDVSCHILLVRTPYSVIDCFYVLQSMVQRVESLYLEEGHWFLLEISLFSD